jgi:IS605 OrfB family transposase
MIVRQAFCYELAPTPVQRQVLARHAGAARWAWNWGLAVRTKAWQRRGETVNAVVLHRLLNRLKLAPRFACCMRSPSAPRRRPYGTWTVRSPTSGPVAAPGGGSAPRGSRSGVRHQRLDALHKATTRLAKAKSVIVVEDLHVAGMLRNRRLARSIADASWAEFGRQLASKCGWYGSRLVVADRWYPSSKTCPACGQATAELPLSQRVYRCQRAG